MKARAFILLTVLALASSDLAGMASAAPKPESVRVTAPDSARLGQPISVRIAVTGTQPLSAIQTEVLFDTAAAEQSGVRYSSRLTGATRSLPSIDTPSGVVVGAWSCDPALCGPSEATGKRNSDVVTIELLPTSRTACDPNRGHSSGRWRWHSTQPRRLERGDRECPGQERATGRPPQCNRRAHALGFTAPRLDP